MKLKEWAMEVAAKATGNPDLPVADSTGVPHRQKGLHFKVHFLYDILSDPVIAATPRLHRRLPRLPETPALGP
ncbi:MAG: hypothetical protein ACTSXJ_01995 [Candidatus Baldrarchaeia archaeon]